MSSRTRSLALALALTGCVEPLEISVDEQSVVGGTEAVPGSFGSMVAIDRLGDDFGPFMCGGSYVAPGWVLTAAHCFDDADPAHYQVIANRHDLEQTGGTVVDVRRIIKHPSFRRAVDGNDIALLELAQKLPIPLVTLAGEHEMTGVIQGEEATVIGWGSLQENGAPSPTLQRATVEVIGVGDDCEDRAGYAVIPADQICIGRIEGGVDTCQGDSGGPAFIQRGTELVQLGITSWGHGCARLEQPGVYTLVPSYRTWIAEITNYRGQNAFTPGDFDGDGDTDLVATYRAGSFWWSSNGNGTFANSSSRFDLWFGAAEYTAGDFNGDRRTDLVITTVNGSFWYFAEANGTWSVPYARPDLRLGAVRFVTGDFNGDGRTDLITTTTSGSNWMFSNGNGTWTTPYGRADLPLGEVAYTPGDFDRDGRTDLVITTSHGSFWYYSNGNGTWATPISRSDLPLGSVEFTPVDFSGDGRTDLVITTSHGSFWYMFGARGAFAVPHVRNDLPRGKVQFTVGDFDGNQLKDLVVTTANGSYWNHSQGNGGFVTRYSRTDLPIGAVRYTPGDFDRDGRTDLPPTARSGTCRTAMAPGGRRTAAPTCGCDRASSLSTQGDDLGTSPSSATPRRDATPDDRWGLRVPGNCRSRVRCVVSCSRCSRRASLRSRCQNQLRKATCRSSPGSSRWSIRSSASERRSASPAYRCW